MEHRSAYATTTRRPRAIIYASAMRWGVGAPPRLGHPPPIGRHQRGGSAVAPTVDTPGAVGTAPNVVPTARPIHAPHASQVRLIVGLDNSDDLLSMLRRALG